MYSSQVYSVALRLACGYECNLLSNLIDIVAVPEYAYTDRNNACQVVGCVGSEHPLKDGTMQ